MPLFLKVAIVIALATVAAGSSAAAVAGSERASGSLDLRADLRLTSRIGACLPRGFADECAARTGSGLVSGLGAVTESYDFLVAHGPPTCAPDLGQALGTSVRLVVAGKGEILFTLAEGGCVGAEQPLWMSRPTRSPAAPGSTPGRRGPAHLA